MSILVLSASDVARVQASWPSQEIQSIIAHVFFTLSHNHARSTTLQPHRTTIDTQSHRVLFMPTRIDTIGTSIKVVSVPLLSDDARGLPASTLVLDESTGAVRALVNARSLTALRTAAGSVLATVLLYPPATSEFKRLVTFGAGSQIRSHITQLLATYPSILHITVVNRTINDRVITLVDRLRDDYPAAQFTAISRTDGGPQVESAVGQADVVCCATCSTAPLFPSEWVRPGTHVILVGSFNREMAEVDTALIRRARKILVDSRSACAIEAGELIAAGVQPSDVVEVGELLLWHGADSWQVDTTRVTELLTGSDVTIFKSVGLGGQDVAISVASIDRAIKMEIGTRIPNFDAC